MAASQILNKEYRAQVIKDIEGDENLKRKEESLKRFEIYNDRLEKYVYDVLKRDLSTETLSQMRVISSINLCKRIIDEQSSVYTKQPNRMMHDSDEKTDELFGNIYSLGRVNTAMKKANVALNLQDQCAVQVIPKAGRIKIKVLQPHHYDVIPNAADPETADVYILSQYDKSRLFNLVNNTNNVTPQPSAVEYRDSNGINTPIADQNDWQSTRGVYVWWSDAYHFITDRNGDILDPVSMIPIDGIIEEAMLLNPLGKKPFVDIKQDSDGEYWQRYGNATVDFTIDMAIILSDVAEVNRLQGFAQAIISAVEPPKDLKIGPQSLLFLKKSKNADPSAQPSFEFASPSPDLNGSIEVIKTFLSMYLTSKGLDAGVVSATGTGEKYASGLDRLLATIEKFEASADDFALFKWAEREVFELIKGWLNVFSGVSQGGLIEELSGIIPDDVNFGIEFIKPSTDISDKDKLDMIEKRLELGMITKVEAIMKDREVDEEKARMILEDIDESEDESELMRRINNRAADGNREEIA